MAHLDAVTDRAWLHEATDLLANAEMLFLIGGSRTGLAIAQFARSLTLSGIRNIVACNDADPQGDNMTFASERDAVVAADTMPPDPLLPPRIVELRKRDISIVLVVDSRTYPALGCDVLRLEAVRDSVFGDSSWTSFECLGAAMVEGIRYHRQAVSLTGDEGVNSIAETDKTG